MNKNLLLVAQVDYDTFAIIYLEMSFSGDIEWLIWTPFLEKKNTSVQV